MARHPLVKRILVMSAAVLGLLSPLPLDAAEPSDPDSVAVTPANVESTKTVPSFTFRARPYPEAKWFGLLQCGVIIMPEPEDDPFHVTFEAGLMRNVGRRWAAGVSVHAEDDAAGLMLRGRRWFGRHVSFDLATGYMNPDRVPPEGGNRTSWLNRAELNLFNVVILVAQTDTWRYDHGEMKHTLTPDLVETGTNWYVGGGLQYVPGLVGTILAALVVLSVFAHALPGT